MLPEDKVLVHELERTCSLKTKLRRGCISEPPVYSKGLSQVNPVTSNKKILLPLLSGTLSRPRPPVPWQVLEAIT